jgi:hypothetical protein
MNPETKVWATSLYYEYCDPFLWIVGINRRDVERHAARIAKEVSQDVAEHAIYINPTFTYRLKDLIREPEYLSALQETGIVVL